ncbi:winged helix-turn-helix transcriptional regulator [Gluconacetobacter aggeris]|uniref:Winged helix-turn-helix transcriptional regulator n=1 Tax=Gluconacetobacter aggeris TaxID=1286186 RepID=A0A7W4ISN6_9PROT|nr:metalloregulator ArsR/SmtB family transcription factor [Gluconacetobacter aggeris]MBB2168316.1 winged helix-turn-helix transcriptional regulator [Gluconacetobacter aggeris]
MSVLTADGAKELAERLKLFAQPQRLLILVQLLDGPRAVSALESSTGIGQPVLSQQLGILRRAGILRTERESRTIFYSFADTEEEKWVRLLLGMRYAQSSIDIQLRPDIGRTPRIAHEEAGAVFARVGMTTDGE